MFITLLTAICRPTRAVAGGLQRSCFTIHSSTNVSFEEQLEDAPLVTKGGLRKYVAVRECVEEIQAQLRLLGVSHSTVVPDFDDLARELWEQFQWPMG